MKDSERTTPPYSTSLRRLAIWRTALPLLLVALAGCGPAGGPPEMPHHALPRDRMPVDPVGPSRLPKPAPHRGTKDDVVGPNGEGATFSESIVRIRRPSGATFDVDPSEVHPPPGDKSLLRISPTSLFYMDDGTLLVGSGDGTVAALDADGHRRFALGFRGAVSEFSLLDGGLVAVTTERGVLALFDGNGNVRWEHQITAEALGAPFLTEDKTILTASQRGLFAYSMAGERVFSHAASDLHVPCLEDQRECHEDTPPSVWMQGGDIDTSTGLHLGKDADRRPVPSLTPTFPLTFRKVMDSTVVSLIPDGKTAILALVTRRAPRNDYEWDTDDKYDVVQLDGATQKRMRVPDVAPVKEVFIEGTQAATAAVFVDSLVRGPNGNPWVLARKLNSEKTSTGDALLGQWGGAGQVFEVTSGKVAERSDLFKTFATHWLSTGIQATPTGTASLFCFGEDDPTCAAYDGPAFRLVAPPAKIAAAARVGDAVWVLTAEGLAYRIEAKKDASFEAAPQPEDTPFRAVAGVNEKDVWADFKKRHVVLHHDGTAWREVPIPLIGESLVARAPDDAWSGRSRWDGTRWSLVHGAPPATTVLAKSKDDVWMGDTIGLWHGTAPGPSPVQLAPIATTGDTAAPRAVPLPLGSPDKRLVAERAQIAVPGEGPLDGASNVAASPDGVLWMLSPDRIVEVGSSGKGTTVRWTGRGTFGKWAVPEGRGRGLLLHRDEARGFDHRDEVRRISGNTTAPADVQMDRHDAVAASVGPSGTAWILGAPADFGPASTFRSRAERLREQGVSSWEDFGAHALVRAGKDAFRPVLGLPAAAWCDVSAAPDGGAWFAGALSEGPAGEGLLVHAKGLLGAEGTTRFRAAATLFAVAAVGPDEAWAVGAGGAILHVKGASVTRYSLPSGEWLRAVHATGPTDVWIGGDGGTLLHSDGQSWAPVPHPLGAHAALTGIASARGEIWAVGPSGLLKITKRP